MRMLFATLTLTALTVFAGCHAAHDHSSTEAVPTRAAPAASEARKQQVVRGFGATLANVDMRIAALAKLTATDIAPWHAGDCYQPIRVTAAAPQFTDDLDLELDALARGIKRAQAELSRVGADLESAGTSGLGMPADLDAINVKLVNLRNDLGRLSGDLAVAVGRPTDPVRLASR